MGEMQLEQQLAELLAELSATQRALLELLGRKQRALAAADLAALQALEPEEQRIVQQLGACQERRTTLLAQAANEGQQVESLRALAGRLPDARRFDAPLREAAARSRLLRHQSLTTWLLAQRTLVHLAQMLEILATGGRPSPTYGRGATAPRSGSLVDQAV
jgi:hypothetical protein